MDSIVGLVQVMAFEKHPLARMIESDEGIYVRIHIRRAIALRLRPGLRLPRPPPYPRHHRRLVVGPQRQATNVYFARMRSAERAEDYRRFQEWANPELIDV